MKSRLGRSYTCDMMQVCMDYHGIIHCNLHKHTIIINHTPLIRRDLVFPRSKNVFKKNTAAECSTCEPEMFLE